MEWHFKKSKAYRILGRVILPVSILGVLLIFSSFTKKPHFPGGRKAFYEFLAKNLKYPDKARDKGLIGKIFVRFIIEKNGSVSNVKALSSPGYGVAEEAERIVKLSPKWVSGISDGKQIRVADTLAIHFIQDNKRIYFDNARPPVIIDTNDLGPLVTSTTNTTDFIYGFGNPAAQFPGGIPKFYNFLYENIRYPDEVLNKNIQGRELIQFIVEKDGSLTNIKTARSLNSILDREAVRVVGLSPKWIPGMFEGHVSRVKYVVLLDFTPKGISASPDYFNINNFGQALILVDGKEIPGIKNTWNMEKIEILNGKAATSLYGAKGKNGVVLMTTYK
jgi:TonB family protein